MPPSLRDWLPADHLAWFVIETVQQLDLDAFYADYRVDGLGRAAYDPAVMVSLLMYAYSTSVRSSRGIERHCRQDVAYRVITGNRVPDHATVARFIVRHEQRLGELFGLVLKLCARAGLVASGVVAIDGTKLSASAASDANVDYDRIARGIIGEAIKTDRAEDEEHGERRGDEFPPELATEVGRRAWIVRELERERSSEDQPAPGESTAQEPIVDDPLDGFDAARIVARTQGREGWAREARRQLEATRWESAGPVPRSRQERLRLAARWLEDDLAAEKRGNTAYEAFREHRRIHDPQRLGGTPKPYSPPEIPEGEVNVTDPDSRRMKGNRRYIQGYNAQAVVNEQQIVIAAEITADAGDFSHLRPMLAAALAELEHGRDRGATRGGRRGRAVLERAAHGRRHRRARDPGTDPAGLRQTQRRTARLDRRALRVHAPGVRDRPRPRDSTENVRQRSSRCSGIPNTTANSPASTDAAGPPCGRSGGYS